MLSFEIIFWLQLLPIIAILSTNPLGIESTFLHTNFSYKFIRGSLCVIKPTKTLLLCDYFVYIFVILQNIFIKIVADLCAVLISRVDRGGH